MVIRLADLDSALSQIEALDLSEEWIPDILRHADQLRRRSDLLSDTARRLATGTHSGSIEVEIPKTPFFTRSGQLIDLEDRIALHAVVASFANLIEAQLAKEVFSARLAPRGRLFLRDGVRQWRRWVLFTRRSLRQGDHWLIKTDLVAYFDTIKFVQLDADIQSLGVSAATRSSLLTMLNRWAASVPGVGLIQGPDACRVLGNLYLLPVDHALLASGIHYSRYMDDIRITGKSKAEVISGFRQLEKQAKLRGLILSPGKTALLSGDEARQIDADDRRERAAYLIDAGHRTAAKRLLRRMLRDSMQEDGHVDARNSKFSLYRLAILHDRLSIMRVLNHLDDLAPIASIVALYIAGHLSEPRVEASLTKYLTDPERVGHSYLMFYLFAAMLERPGLLPVPWLDVAASVLRDTAEPPWLRGVAANVLARGNDVAQKAWMRQEATRSADLYLARCLVVALARGGALDASTASACAARDPYLERAVAYLSKARFLPSLVRRGRLVRIGI